MDDILPRINSSLSIIKYKSNSVSINDKELEKEIENELYQDTFKNQNGYILTNETNYIHQDFVKYQRILKLIEKHILFCGHAHPLSIIFYQYKKYFIEKYDNQTNISLIKKKKQDINERKIYQYLIEDLKTFLNILGDSIILFYEINSFLEERPGFKKLFSKDNFDNFVSSVVFTEEIYKIIFEYQENIDYELNKKLTKNYLFSISKILKPKDFGVSSKFYNIKKKIPFIDPINLLNKMKFAYSPCSKLKILMDSSKIIMENINSYYLINEEKPFKKDELSSEDLICIFVYIIAQSKIQNLISECNFIETFISGNSMSNIYGYYLLTLKASALYFANLNLPEEILNKD